ncbi:MAG: 5-oxoprolinase subunit PxpB [Candidatus Heimdallarchaeota archaeon]
MATKIHFRLAGDNYLFVEFGKEIAEEINQKVVSTFLALEEQEITGLRELIPTFCSLCLNYDPLKVTASELQERIDMLLRKQRVQQLRRAKRVEIPTVYGGEYGPDLESVAEYHGLSPEEVIALHQAGEYWVGLVGFLAGYPYLGGLSPKIATPRLKTPRTSVPGGSVGIAGNLTGIYPVSSPGGWQIIGRTPIQLFDVKKHPPALLSVGDRVKFMKISENEFKQLGKELESKEKLKRPTTLLSSREAIGTLIFRVTNPGLFTTIQDLGRPFYQKYGVSVSGTMDRYAARIANLLVGNAEDQGCLEVTIMGPTLEVLNKTLLAITGGNLSPLLNNEPTPMWQTFLAYPGDIISFGGWKSGARAYIALTGGIQVPKILGSCSTHVGSRIGGLTGRRLRSGDILKGESPSYRLEPLEGIQIPLEMIPSYELEANIRVLLGPQEEYYTPEGLDTFLSAQYTITVKSDRMGYRLQGPKIENIAGTDIISEAIPLGAIQVPGDGQPIIMMADRQTTGGYSKIANVINVDVDTLAQMPPLSKIKFQTITLKEAYWLFREREETVANLAEVLKSERLLRIATF